jgi:hypothetical protein
MRSQVPRALPLLPVPRCSAGHRLQKAWSQSARSATRRSESSSAPSGPGSNQPYAAPVIAEITVGSGDNQVWRGTGRWVKELPADASPIALFANGFP